MKKMKIKSVALITLLLIGLGCSTTRNLEQVNLAHLYQEEGVVLKPLFRVYHLNNDSTRVFFEGSSDQLLYVKEQSQNDFIARIGVRYRLYTDYQLTTLIDSGSTTLTDIQADPKTSIIFGYFDLYFERHSHNDKYVLEILLTDKNRNLTYIDLISVDRSDKQNSQPSLARQCQFHAEQDTEPSQLVRTSRPSEDKTCHHHQ